MIKGLRENKVFNVMDIITSESFEGMGKAMAILFNEVMRVERSRYLQAEPYQRTEDRNGYANGYKDKQVKTRLGSLDLQVPQVRDGDFYPSIIEKGIRSERALKLALAEMYIQGVSTRKVEKITKIICGLSFTSAEVSRATKMLDAEITSWNTRPLGEFIYVYFDAIFEKCHNTGCIIDTAVLVAIGITPQGVREVIGVSVSESEAELHWRQFMLSLVERGLHGVKLITSDAHSGLKAARKKVFSGVPWQRCQFHLQQNAQSYVSKVLMRKEVARDIKSVFNAPNREEAERLLKMIVLKYEKSAPRLSQWLEENITEGLTVFSFPEHHQIKIRTSNIVERQNKEIRRRTRVVGIFPNNESCLRLVSAILMETHQEWASSKVYLNMTLPEES